MTTWGLILVWDNATDKVGLCGPQVSHQLVEVLLGGGERGESTQDREAELEIAVDQPVKDWEPGTSACLCVSFQSVPVTLCPFLFDWIPVTITKVFIPPPNSATSLPQALVAPPTPKPCPGSVGTGSSTDLL